MVALGGFRPILSQVELSVAFAEGRKEERKEGRKRREGKGIVLVGRGRFLTFGDPLSIGSKRVVSRCYPGVIFPVVGLRNLASARFRRSSIANRGEYLDERRLYINTYNFEGVG